jgi:hypothetical protein
MKFPEENMKVYLTIILLINFILRLVIYWKTVLFNFSDYQIYLTAVDRIYNEGEIPLISGNFLFTISYIGYLAKYILGSSDLFFVFNCLLGTLTTWLIAVLITRLTGKPASGVITALILTFYTEFMVFSSVFYTPVIMLFLLVLLMISIYYFYTGTSKTILFLSSGIILVVFLITFFFKPELVFFPLFLLFIAFIFIRKQRFFFQRSMILVMILFTGIFLIKASGIFNKPEGDAIANDFIFFGHTDYGGGGGEGSFIFPGNKLRYNEALSLYRKEHEINELTVNDRNRFQIQEIKRYITHHPLKWTGLQFTKFFRTFGVVPESTSFKILYTGLLKNKLLLTSFVVVAPVSIIILMFILFFNFSEIKQLFRPSAAGYRLPATSLLKTDAGHRIPHTDFKKHFIYVYCLLFFYYFIITIFLGHYQERYRMPLMVVFIIPALGFYIASFNNEQFLKKSSLIIKSAVIVLFLSVWVFQAKKAISDKDRLESAIESVKRV